MDKRTYFYTTAVVFLVIGLLHLTRAFRGWEAVIGGVEIPVWASWVVVALAGYLALTGFEFAKK
jgi:hypothetical protein